jgi:hypothetical protein
MKSILLACCLLLAALPACVAPKSTANSGDKGVLLLTLGSDTTVLHQFEIKGDSFYSAVLSVPQGLRLTEGRGVFFPNGDLKAVKSRVSVLDTAGRWTLAQETEIRCTADSTIVRATGPGNTYEKRIPGHCMLTNYGDATNFQLFPYYGFFAPRHVRDSFIFKHVTALGARDLVLKRNSKTELEVGSSTMGVIHLVVDKNKRLLSADARGSSLNFTAKTYRDADFDGFVRRFEQKQRRFGPAPSLSVRDTIQYASREQRIEINYWRPSARGRRIFGEIVPMNRFWRLGANNATEITLKQAVRFGDKRLEAGKYTLFVIPSEDQWTLLVNRKTGIWGTEYDAAADVLRVPLEVAVLPQHVEQLTLSVSPNPSGGTFNIEWERTRASVGFENVR